MMSNDWDHIAMCEYQDCEGFSLPYVLVVLVLLIVGVVVTSCVDGLTAPSGGEYVEPCLSVQRELRRDTITITNAAGDSVGVGYVTMLICHVGDS